MGLSRAEKGAPAYLGMFVASNRKDRDHAARLAQIARTGFGLRNR